MAHGTLRTRRVKQTFPEVGWNSYANPCAEKILGSMIGKIYTPKMIPKDKYVVRTDNLPNKLFRSINCIILDT